MVGFAKKSLLAPFVARHLHFGLDRKDCKISLLAAWQTRPPPHTVTAIIHTQTMDETDETPSRGPPSFQKSYTARRRCVSQTQDGGGMGDTGAEYIHRHPARWKTCCSNLDQHPVFQMIAAAAAGFFVGAAARARFCTYRHDVISVVVVLSRRAEPRTLVSQSNIHDEALRHGRDNC